MGQIVPCKDIFRGIADLLAKLVCPVHRIHSTISHHVTDDLKVCTRISPCFLVFCGCQSDRASWRVWVQGCGSGSKHVENMGVERPSVP